MAKTPFLRQFNANANYTFPPGKHFVGTLISASTTGALTVGGVEIPQRADVLTHGPLVVAGGSVLTTTANYGAGVFSGFLYDD